MISHQRYEAAGIEKQENSLEHFQTKERGFSPLRVPPHSSFLVTGGAGFIGINFAEYLTARGHHARCLVRRTSGLEPLQKLNCELLAGDVLDESLMRSAVADVDYVVHLAGLTAAFSPQDFLRANVTGTESLVSACAKRETPPVLVHVSSIAAAGPVPTGTIRSEADPASPVSTYGVSKLAGEVAVRKWAQEVPITIVRPGIVFGPHDHGMLPIYQTMKNLRCHVVPAWNPPPLSFIYVGDLCDLMERAAAGGERLPVAFEEQTMGTGIYFAVDQEHPDYAELGRILRPLMNRPFAPIFRFPGLLPLGIAKLSEWIARFKGRPGQLNLDKIREARATSWACSAEKSERQLGFTPARPLVERFAQTIAWYRNENWL